MRRRRYRKKPTAVSLFPFLAVLICTMGALIVLLVLGVQQAQVQATEVVNAKAQQRKQNRAALEKKRRDVEDAKWKWDMLVPAHVEKAQELTDQRHKLGHLEEHIRQLEEKWRAVQQQAQRIRAEVTSTAQGKISEADIEQLNRDILRAKRDLEDARRKRDSQPRSFSLVPYDGPNGTRRRPLYVECTANGIHLRPEDITLTEKDFQPPFGPGNPLASALRAKRDLLVSQGLVGPQAEPYPLIIVRPGGSVHYALAREAMKSWEDEFGYELVDQSMKLKFPPRNDEAVRHVQRAIDAALQRQEFIARAQPRLFGRQGGIRGGEMRASRRGGFVPVNSNGMASRSADDDLTGDSRRRAAERNRSRNASRNSPTGQAGPVNGPDGPGGPSSVRGMSEFPRAGGGRSQNWGLPNSQGRGIQRYVRVACEANRLTILPARDERARPRVIELRGATHDNVDRFVSQLWEHMKGWGLALPGRYWEPILTVEVTSSGEQRFQELQQTLQKSGIIVKRRQ